MWNQVLVSTGGTLSGIDVVAGREIAAGGQSGEFFGIELIDPAEAAELAFDAVVEAVMVGVARDEAVAADAIDRSRRARPHGPGTAACVTHGVPAALSAR